MELNIKDELTLVCQKVQQNNVEFFLGKISAADLFQICSVTNRVILAFDETGYPIYNDKIQRKPNTLRVNSIKDYLLSDQSACFPNNIIVALPSILIKNEVIPADGDYFSITIDKTKINITSDDNPLYAQIIDGQHRFRGMQVAIEELALGTDKEKLAGLSSFEFVISFFIDPEIEFQAMLFSTINRTPVKVSTDLVYDLFGLVNGDSPQKTSLAITLELNGYKQPETGEPGPFYKRIRLLGKKVKDESSPLSQGIFIRTLLLLICPSLKIADVERFYDRSQFSTGGSRKTIFRSYFASDQDNLMFKVLLNYFQAVKKVFVDDNGNSYWDIGTTPDNVLQRTIGFLALTDILAELYHKGLEEKRLSLNYFTEQLTKAKGLALFDDNNQSLYPYSSAGRIKLREDLMALIF